QAPGPTIQADEHINSLKKRQLQTMKPKVFFVVGPAGSGKSSVSKFIARQNHAAYIDKDTATTGFTELLLELRGFDKNERDNNEYYQTVIMPLEYETILKLCRDNLALGNSVVLDAPFGKYFSNEDFLTEVHARYYWPEAEKIVVHVHVDGEEMRQRLINRGYHRDEWKLHNWDAFWAKAQSVDCAWKSAHHVAFNNNGDGIDTTEFDRVIEGIDAEMARL
ncbi:ATP-binding protein, partial [Cryobacterium sp. RTC2.1]